MSDAQNQSAGRERLIRVVAVTSLAFSTFYIVWRWGWTINTEALWYSVPLAVAETYGLLTAFFLTFTAWGVKRRTPPAALRDRTVDVFVTTYDESLKIIRKTTLAARELRYPHATYILDDGRREEVRTLAEELGVGYIRRDNNQHAKAGNLNNALKHSSGEFILQLDADHVPLPHMIDRLLGFFADERVAFVQSPQDFYNTDAFTYDVDEQTRRIWEDQQLFFRVLQPGKDRVNAAFFVGSCALIRRQAIDEIGGFATATVTEDIETSLLLHARGWRSVYLNETLAYGLAPANARAFHVQHLRWGQGAMQVIRKYSPLRMPGLTVAQRLAYLDSLSTYLGGFQRLILYLAPIIFFATGEFPLNADAGTFAAIFIPYMLLQLASFKLLARGHGSFLLADRYAMAKFVTHLRAITGFATRRRLKFRVTPKGEAEVPAGTYAPQLALVLITIAAVAWGGYQHYLGIEEDIPGWGASAFWANVIFALWNGCVAAYIVLMSLRSQQRRAEHRFADALAVDVRVQRADSRLVASDIAIVDNLNPYGASMRAMHAIDPDSRVEMTLPLNSREVAVRGRVVHRRESSTPYGTVHVHGVEFDRIGQEVRDAIELHCAQYATPLDRQRYAEGAQSPHGMLRRLRNLRSQRRVSVGMPARVVVGVNGVTRELGVGLLEDVSPHGARVLLDHPVAAGSTMSIQIPGSDYDASGRVAFVRALETSVGMRFIVGFDTGSPGVKGAGGGRRLYAAITRLAREYTLAARTRSRAAGVAAGRAISAAWTAAGNAAGRLKRPQPQPALDFIVALDPALAHEASSTERYEAELGIPVASMSRSTVTENETTAAVQRIEDERWRPEADSDNITIPTVQVEVANPFAQLENGNERLAVPTIDVSVANPLDEPGTITIPKIHVEISPPTFPT